MNKYLILCLAVLFSAFVSNGADAYKLNLKDTMVTDGDKYNSPLGSPLRDGFDKDVKTSNTTTPPKQQDDDCNGDILDCLKEKAKELIDKL